MSPRRPAARWWPGAGRSAGGLAVALCLGASGSAGCAGRLDRPPAPAEIVLTHGVVYTLDPAQPWAEALAIADRRIVAVGTHEEVMLLRGADTRVVDLHGQLVLPGFHDTHVHPITGGIELGQCALAGLDTRGALEAVLRECVQAIDDEGDEAWLLGGGWELTLFDQGNPSRQSLDAIVPDVPAFLISADGHSAWLNSEALRRAGITAQTPDPPNGRIERDTTGEPSGTLREAAVELVEPHVPELPPEAYVEGLRRGLGMANRFGITGMVDAAAGPELLAAYERLHDDGELTARVVAAQVVDPLRGPEQLGELEALRRRVRRPSLRADVIKIFADGVIEAGTAALLAPYEGSLAGHGAGEPVFSPQALEDIVVAADGHGFDVHVHAIGDRAVRTTLDAFEAALARNLPRERRHVIAHLELVDPHDIPRFRALGVAACFQPLWAFPDPYITELTIPVLGPQRSRWLYPIGSVLATDALVAAGSDWSVSSMDPLEGITVAITRRGVGERPGEPWIPEEVASLRAMIAAYTRSGARVARWDDETGSLVVGKRADLAVIEGNVFELPAHRVHEADVVTTLLDGAVVYRGPGDRIGGG